MKFLHRFMGPVARVIYDSLGDPDTKWRREDSADLILEPQDNCVRLYYGSGMWFYRLRAYNPVGNDWMYRFTLVEKICLRKRVRAVGHRRDKRDHGLMLSQLTGL